MIISNIMFSSKKAAVDFVEKNISLTPDFFGTINPKDIISAINAIEILIIPEHENEEDVICHGLEYFIKMDIDIHSYGGLISPEGWTSDSRNKVSITREVIVNYIYKKAI